MLRWSLLPRALSGSHWTGSRPVLEIFGRFLMIGALAFGGGEAALPIVERLTVADTGWLTPGQRRWLAPW